MVTFAAFNIFYLNFDKLFCLYIYFFTVLKMPPKGRSNAQNSKYKLLGLYQTNVGIL